MSDQEAPVVKKPHWTQVRKAEQEVVKVETPEPKEAAVSTQLVLNGRKVKSARLQPGVVVHVGIQGIAQMGPVIDKNSGKTLNSIDITKVEGGIFLIGKDSKNNEFELFIPDVNFASILLEAQ